MNNTTTKHTPGRWIVNVWTTGRRTIETEGGLVIAEVHRVHVDEEQKGNAHLIAAAPDMLYALKSFVGYYDQAGMDDDLPVEEDDNDSLFDGDERFNVRLARATIKAAEGE